MAATVSIIEAMESPKLFGRFFPGIETWRHWQVFLKAIYQIPLTPDELAFFAECTARQQPPERVESVFCISGRRSGKSKICSYIAAYESIFGRWRERMIPGERNWVVCVATDKAQAAIVYDGVRSMLSTFPDLVEREGQDELWLSNGCSIAIKPPAFRTVRGYNISTVIWDECGYAAQEGAANPDKELLVSLLGAMTADNKRLIGISTPFLKQGLLWEMFDEFYGKDDDEVMVWKSSTADMNPTFRTDKISKLLRRNRVLFTSEYLGEFREFSEGFFPLPQIELYCTGEQRRPDSRHRYVGFVDMSGGRGDSAALAIAHNEGEQVVLDLVREITAPHEPAEAVKELAGICKHFHIYEVVSDRYGAAWVSSAYRKHGLTVRYSELSKTELYFEMLPMFTSGQLTLLNDATLKGQMMRLERIGNKVDIPNGQSDDVVNATAGAVAHAAALQPYLLTPEEQEARMPQPSGHAVKPRTGFAIADEREKDERQQSCHDIFDEDFRKDGYVKADPFTKPRSRWW